MKLQNEPLPKAIDQELLTQWRQIYEIAKLEPGDLSGCFLLIRLWYIRAFDKEMIHPNLKKF